MLFNVHKKKKKHKMFGIPAVTVPHKQRHQLHHSFSCMCHTVPN